MAQSISLTIEAPTFSQNNVPANILPPFGHQRRSINQSNKSRRSTNTLPNRTKQNSRSESTLRKQADVIRYATGRKSEESLYDQIEMQQRIYFHNVFSPDVHSTPLYKHKHEAHKETSSSSLSNLNNNQHLPNFYINDYELFKSSTNHQALPEHRNSVIPTLSARVEGGDSSRSTVSAGAESKVIKKRGVCGVSWILRLGFRDSTVNKVYRRQIGWIVLVLIIFILIGSALVPFSSHFSSYHFIQLTTNFTQIPPKMVAEENVTIAVRVTTTTTAASASSATTATTTTTSTTQEPMYSEDANIVIMVTEDLPSVVLVDTKPEKSTLTNKNSNLKTDNVMWNEAYKNNDNLTNELMGFCRGCRKDLDICIATPDSGVPICRTARDLNDPTGCGGLCALEIEACHLLNQQFSIYTCRPVQNLQPCEEDEWRCANLLCIPDTKRCDGHMNCYDKSDEMECMCDLTTKFQCGNKTSCLDLSKKCDGNIDCWDGSDEVNCTQTCPDDQFTCNNGECIQRNLFCDGLADCADKTDEPSGCDGGCRKYEFKCSNKRCIAKTAVCNGFDNCGDMSDETNCPVVKSSSS